MARFPYIRKYVKLNTKKSLETRNIDIMDTKVEKQQVTSQQVTSQQVTSQQVTLIALEGNISAGKSTLCSKMPKEHNGLPINVRFETIPKGLLALFYSGLSKKPNPYAFTLQINQLARRSCDMMLAKSELKESGGGYAIFDRSLLGDFIFALQHYWNGNISEDEFAVYLEEAKISQIQKILKGIDHIFYLYTPPTNCLNNVRKRGDVDSTIPISLLQELDLLHGHVILWIMFRFNIKVSVLDWTHFGTPDDIFDHVDKSNIQTVTFTRSSDEVKSNDGIKKDEWTKTSLLPYLKKNFVLSPDSLHNYFKILSQGKSVDIPYEQNIFDNSVFTALDEIYSNL